ncbi:MAG: hypothetical protein ACYDBQ_02520 [Thermoplasmatota archaeon]
MLGATFDVQRAELIVDPELRRALEEFRGADLEVGPELQFTIVPEMRSKPHELRFPATASIMQLFRSDTATVTIREIVDQGLDRLLPSVAVKARQKLDEDMEVQVDVLLAKHGMKEYLEKEGRTLRPKVGTNLGHFKTREKIQAILEAWVSASTAPVTLSEFDP